MQVKNTLRTHIRLPIRKLYTYTYRPRGSRAEGNENMNVIRSDGSTSRRRGGIIYLIPGHVRSDALSEMVFLYGYMLVAGARIFYLWDCMRCSHVCSAAASGEGFALAQGSSEG